LSKNYKMLWAADVIWKYINCELLIRIHWKFLNAQISTKMFLCKRTLCFFISWHKLIFFALLVNRDITIQYSIYLYTGSVDIHNDNQQIILKMSQLRSFYLIYFDINTNNNTNTTTTVLILIYITD